MFSSARSGTIELWTCDSNGGEPAKLTSFGGPATISTVPVVVPKVVSAVQRVLAEKHNARNSHSYNRFDQRACQRNSRSQRAL